MNQVLRKIASYLNSLVMELAISMSRSLENVNDEEERRLTMSIVPDWGGAGHVLVHLTREVNK